MSKHVIELLQFVYDMATLECRVNLINENRTHYKP